VWKNIKEFPGKVKEKNPLIKSIISRDGGVFFQSCPKGKRSIVKGLIVILI
jgi:hypothetical protein